MMALPVGPKRYATISGQQRVRLLPAELLVLEQQLRYQPLKPQIFDLKLSNSFRYKALQDWGALRNRRMSPAAEGPLVDLFVAHEKGLHL